MTCSANRESPACLEELLSAAPAKSEAPIHKLKMHGAAPFSLSLHVRHLILRKKRIATARACRFPFASMSSAGLEADARLRHYTP